MTDLILHHFDLSPFAEKIRKLFGVKRLKWRSVDIPMVMPKPDLTELTGGYRKTPVLQIGADIYCDTMLIAQTIERLHPEPPVFQGGPLVNLGLQHWSDASFFPPGAGLSLYENADQIPTPVTKDREAYFSYLDFDRFAEDAPHYRSQFRAHAALIEAQLRDGRPFLAGDAASWFDIGAYFNIWMAGGNIPSATRMLAPFERLAMWRTRMENFAHGEKTALSAVAAIDIAMAADPATPADHVADESGAEPGDRIAVTPTDIGKVPVEGVLVASTNAEIVIARDSERAGRLHVHFPRIGYRIARL